MDSCISQHLLFSPQPDDGCLEGGPEDEEYDALNDETFGSAMVDGDWEEGHEQMATLTEAGRISNKHKQLQNALRRDVRASFMCMSNL